MKEKINWGTNKVFSILEYALYFTIGLIFAPVYILSYILNVIARILLGISYFGLGEGRKGSDVFRFMFRPYDGEL